MGCWVKLAQLRGKNAYLPSGKALYMDYIVNACFGGLRIGLYEPNLYLGENFVEDVPLTKRILAGITTCSLIVARPALSAKFSHLGLLAEPMPALDVIDIHVNMFSGVLPPLTPLQKQESSQIRNSEKSPAFKVSFRETPLKCVVAVELDIWETGSIS
ncbi:hypothetical protein AgCh_038288 [Apium graveolens]